jgi:hypothetical protein
MAYMTADTSAKVGFRPYLETDAKGAAQLSGLGQNHPFKSQAWHLHGVDGAFLGTYHLNRPFDPWELAADVHHTAGVRTPGIHGLGYLGDTTDITTQAVQELENAGAITTAEGDSILEGSMSFTDVLGYDPTDQSSWLSFTGMLQDWNSSLQALEAQYQATGPQAGNQAFIQLGQDLIAHRNAYSALATQFVKYYTLMTGSTPPGLSGLGIIPVLVYVAGSIIFIVTAYLAYQAFKIWQASVNVQAIAAQTQAAAGVSTAATNANLLTSLAKAQASGDTVTAQAILKTLAVTGAQPAAASTTEAWLMTNAKWLALGAAALIAVGPLSQGLFGGKRR